jgi:hypothetical protein
VPPGRRNESRKTRNEAVAAAMALTVVATAAGSLARTEERNADSRVWPQKVVSDQDAATGLCLATVSAVFAATITSAWPKLELPMA